MQFKRVVRVLAFKILGFIFLQLSSLKSPPAASFGRISEAVSIMFSKFSDSRTVHLLISSL